MRIRTAPSAVLRAATMLLVASLLPGTPAARAEDDGAPAGGPAAAEPISFKAGVEKAEVTLGEPFTATIEVRHRAGETYSLPAGLKLEPFHLRSVQTDTRGQDPRTTTFRLELQAFALGEQEIPAIPLEVARADGNRVLEIPPQALQVVGVIDPEQGEPKMREDQRALPTRHRTVWWPLAVIGAVVAAVLLVMLLRRRRGRVVAAPLEKPRPPAYDEAILRLDELAGSPLVGEGRYQIYFFRLSEIVRDYVGRRYGFEALELTTDELLEHLRRRHTPGLDFDGFATFLAQSDLVKFARQEASAGECKEALDSMRRLVERSRPPAEPGRAAG